MRIMLSDEDDPGSVCLNLNDTRTSTEPTTIKPNDLFTP
jgi:hypothetical protein